MSPAGQQALRSAARIIATGIAAILVGALAGMAVVILGAFTRMLATLFMIGWGR